MKVLGDLKGLLKFEKKFNTDLMPAKLSIEDISNLTLFLCFQIISFLLISLNVATSFAKNNIELILTDLITIIIFLVCSLTIFLIFSDDIKRHNSRYLFFKDIIKQNSGEGNNSEKQEVFKVDKYFYDITEKKTIQYTLKENTSETNDLNFNVRYIKTKLLENENEYELIETSNEEKYKIWIFMTVSIVQIISCTISLGLSHFERIENIIALIAIHSIPIIVSVLCLIILGKIINFNAEKDNISKIKKEL
ncbi:hypothetical protein ACUW92_000992 [Staphylococcus epidermidis]|uniref:hypothetical protein n=1 Tax=Staphylococcus epidermidis TaxID=1282 RepID=UPI001931A76A|nr:hypothetical protein [Staphylococcus epidermidis]MBM0846778.1 hypothetical protein [Staphylococcus epidermidis]MCG1980481.1 hypothetical protein [Staphylococcus epidermidis]MCG1991600.1 hypothetical protein [Staphylococcus epidermidis]MCG1996114.1 hypothetical protein [Staphylococcus epidermidis]